MCKVHFHQAIMEKSNQKTGKHTAILVFEKVTQLVARASVAIRKKKKNQHTLTLAYFDNWKKKQQDQSSKNLCDTESFMSLPISNLRTTVFCFENIKLFELNFH